MITIVAASKRIQFALKDWCHQILVWVSFEADDKPTFKNKKEIVSKVKKTKFYSFLKNYIANCN